MKNNYLFKRKKNCFLFCCQEERKKFSSKFENFLNINKNFKKKKKLNIFY